MCALWIGVNVSVIDGNKVEEVSSFKTLGINFSNTLSFDNHVDEIVKKSRSIIGTIRRLSYKVDSKALKMVTEAKILSKLTYGGFIYITPQIDNLLLTYFD